MSSMLGKLLGDTIKEALGEEILDKVDLFENYLNHHEAGNEVQRQNCC